MKFKITAVYEVDIPDDEYYAMDEPLHQIKDDVNWYIRMYGYGWCEEVEQLGRPY